MWITGCAREPSAPEPATASVTPAPTVSETVLAPVPELPNGALLVVADRQSGVVHRFWSDGRWEAHLPTAGWVSQEPRPPQRPWTGRMHPDGLARLTESLAILADVPSVLPPPTVDDAPILPGAAAAVARHPVVFVGRLPGGDVRTVALDAHLDRPDTFGALQPLWTVLDEVAFGSRFDR